MYLAYSSINYMIKCFNFTEIIRAEHFNTDYLMTTLLSDNFSINTETNY